MDILCSKLVFFIIISHFTGLDKHTIYYRICTLQNSNFYDRGHWTNFVGTLLFIWDTVVLQSFQWRVVNNGYHQIFPAIPLNLMLLYNLMTNKSIDEERAANEKIRVALDSPITAVGKAI